MIIYTNHGTKKQIVTVRAYVQCTPLWVFLLKMTSGTMSNVFNKLERCEKYIFTLD